MLSTASRAQPRARLLQARTSSHNAVSASAVALLQSRCGNQTREFCFGAWASYFGPDTPSGGRRRHRMLRYRYTESLYRDVPWKGHGKATIDKLNEHAHGASSSRNAQKYANVDEVKSWSDDISGVRPGANIEDVERGAMNHLLEGDPRSALYNLRDYLTSQLEKRSVAPEDVTKAAATPDTDASPIDPITNRRVPKSAGSEKSPSTTYGDLDGYRPVEFSERSSPDEIRPKYNDLSKYGPIEDGNAATAAVPENESQYSDLKKYGAAQWNEPDGVRKLTPEENSKDYKDLNNYSSVEIDSPDAVRKPTPEEQSKFYGDLHKYRPEQWNEPDGLRKETTEELTKNYDDLDRYGAVSWNEPDGLRQPTPEELSKDYEDVSQYGAVRWSEPDGLRRLTPEEESKAYDDLASYTTPHAAEDSTLRAYQISQMDRTVRGTPLGARVHAPEYNPAEEYKDLDKYGPVHWNEPDGLRKLTPEERSKDYNDLHLYGAVQWNEPDGLRQPTPEEASRQYEDTSLYAARDLSGPSQRIHPEEASKKYTDLSGYKVYPNGGPSVSRLHPEEASKKYEDLDRYSASEVSNTKTERVHPEEASKQYKDLADYTTSEDFGQRVHPEELTKNYNDLGKYQPTTFDDVDKPYPMHPEEASKVYKDLGGYSKAPPSTLDALASSLQASDTKACSQDDHWNGPSFTHTRRHNFTPDSTDPNAALADGLSAQDIRAATLRRAQERSQSDELERTNASGISDSDGVGQRFTDIEETDKSKELADAYSISWNGGSPKTDPPKAAVDEIGAKTIRFTDRDGAELGSMEEGFPMENIRTQTALERHLENEEKELASDLYSQQPTGLETSYAEECGGQETTPFVEKHYQEEQVVKEDKEDNNVASYKILAFDPVTQAVNMAEASSTPGESESTSSLAEVLLRLSNPSKFLPYLERLQADGYDVVSGSGDILIFRQVRSAGSMGRKSPNPAMFGSARINPIDMMGKPVMGNFASPTGFVNYDAVSEPPHKPAPPFRSEEQNHDQDREDEMPKANSEVGGRKKRRLGRKLVMGTAGLAGSAYAVAVLAEYFSTRPRVPREGSGRRL